MVQYPPIPERGREGERERERERSVYQSREKVHVRPAKDRTGKERGHPHTHSTS